jgi:hypothetical protein
MESIKPKDAELAAAFSGSAVYSNRFFVTLGPVVRIAFTEQRSPEDVPLYRAAVALAHEDAISLANVLKTLLADIEKQIADMKDAESVRARDK